MNLDELPPPKPAVLKDEVEGWTVRLPHWTSSGREHGDALEGYTALTQHMARLVQMDLIRSYREFWASVPEETTLKVMWGIGSSSDYFDIVVTLDTEPATHLDVIRASEALREACEAVPVSKDVLWPLAERDSPFRGSFTRAAHLSVLAQAEAKLMNDLAGPLHRHQAQQRSEDLAAAPVSAPGRRRRRS